MEDAHSMQCSGRRGVCAMVHMGKVTRGGNRSSVHSKHALMRGMITRAWPLKPSVPPSMMGMMVRGSISPSSVYSTSSTTVLAPHPRPLPPWAAVGSSALGTAVHRPNHGGGRGGGGGGGRTC